MLGSHDGFVVLCVFVFLRGDGHSRYLLEKEPIQDLICQSLHLQIENGQRFRCLAYS